MLNIDGQSKIKLGDLSTIKIADDSIEASTTQGAHHSTSQG